MHRIARIALAAGLLLLLPAAATAGPEAPAVAGEDAWPATGAANGDGVSPPSAALRTLAKAPPRLGRVLRLAPLDAGRLRREDAEEGERLGSEWKRRYRVGVVRDVRPVVVPPVPARWGRAETLPDGSRVFRVTVESPGATGLRLRLGAADLPKGAEITVHDADEPEESYGPLRLPRDAAGWMTPTVLGERVVLALRVPAASVRDRVRLVVDGVSHRYRAPDETPGDDGPAAKSELRASNLSCIRSVACDGGADGTYDTVSRAVARFEFTNGGNSFLCSGTLLNDLDESTQIPWLLTANHCVSTDKVARTVEIWWDYKASSCGGAPPSLLSVPRTVGTTLVATSGATDCTLLRITGQLPSNRYFCGWTAARPSAGDPVTGVHHPEGSHMRVSFGDIDSSGAHFHTVVWRDGVTAQGSSGSALLNEQNQVIGQLCCGASYCSKPRAPDDYGRFDVSYPEILAPSLGGTTPSPGPDAWDPADDTPSGATDLGAPTFAGTTHGPHTLSGSDAEDWFLVTLEAGVPYVVDSPDRVVATVFSDATGTAVAVPEKGGTSGFSIVLAPEAGGPHTVRVRRAVAGADTAYQLQVQRQDTIPPEAVRSLKAVARSGLVTLTWRDRAGDEVGYRVEMLGAEGWVRVGELPANSRRFRHRPGPGLQLYRVGPYDPVSTNWRERAVRVRGKPGLDSWDPADDTGAGATALPRTPGTTATHELDRNDVADWFRIDLVAGETWSFETESAGGDTVGTVFADAGGLEPLADGDDQEDEFGAVADYDFRIDFTAPSTGAYWIRVRAYPATPRATYTLRTTLLQ